MKKLVAVIVTFNRVGKLKKAYVTASKEPFAGIIIVNNASTDGTRDYLDSLADSRLTVINKTENTGGAGGFYSGFKCALEKYEADWLVCFDDDAFPKAGIADKFYQNYYAKDVGGVVSAVFTPDGSICEMNRPSIDPFSNWRLAARVVMKGAAAFHLSNLSYRNNNQVDVDSGSFVGLFLRTNVIRKTIGLPRKELFLYGEDTIYTLLIRKSGYRLIFDPSLVFFHDNTDVVNGRLVYSQLWRIYYSYRNGLEIYRLVAGRLFPIVAIGKFFIWLYRVRLYTNKNLYLKMLWYGYVDGLLRKYDRSHPEILSFGDF